MKKLSIVAAAVVTAGLAPRMGFAQNLGADLSVSKGVNSGISAPSLQNAPITPQTPPRRAPEVVASGQPASGGGPVAPVPPGADSTGGGPATGAAAAAGAGPTSVTGPPMRYLTSAEQKQAVKDTALFQAAYAGETWKVRDALQKGAKVNATDWQYGFTPLMWASIKGRLGTVRYLLKHGAQPNVASRRGVSFLLAVSSRTMDSYTTQTETNYMSWQRRMTLHALNGGITALQLAAGQGYNQTVRELLAHKADPNMAEPDGGTALMLAAFSGNQPAVRALLESGARVNAVDSSGISALYFAMIENNSPMVRLLLSKGARVRASRGRQGADLAAEARLHGFKQVAAMLDAAAKKEKTVVAKEETGKTPQASGDGIILLN